MLKNTLLLISFFCCTIVFAQEGEEIDIESTVDATTADVPFATIENVPVYPGCEGGDNSILKKCMSDNIAEVVSANFNMKLVKSMNLRPGRHRISVQFKIDKQGFVTNVRSRAETMELEEEAIRVVRLLPQMKPGFQRGKEVGVLYALPIVFEVENPETEKREKKRKDKKKKQI